MKARGVFVTGTDTGVGKTVVAAGLLCALRRAGVDAVPMKPVQTGCRRQRGEWAAPDLDFCLDVAELSPTDAEQRRMCPYRFGPACSPHLAAARAGVRISLPRIAAAFGALAKAHEAVVVEGAGGVLVPLGPRHTMLDLMRRLGLPVVLVARPSLGTLNHTLLSLRELQRAGLSVAGVVLVATRPGRSGWIERDNRATIERLGKVRILGTVLYLRDFAAGTMSPRRFRTATARIFAACAAGRASV